MALIGNAKQARVWRCETKQTMSEGKSGPVETGLTGLAAKALDGVVACIYSDTELYNHTSLQQFNNDVML